MTEQRYTVDDPAGFSTLQALAEADRFNAWMYSVIKPYLKGNVLEIGSGIGNLSKYVVKDGYTVTLSDYNPTYSSCLQQQYGSLANVRAVLCVDLQHPSFFEKYSALKECFDTVYLLNVIEHLSDEDKAIAYCRYLLKPDGNLIVLAPAYSFLYCPLDKELGHYRRYTTGKLEQLLIAQRFAVFRKRYFNAMGIAGWFLFGKVLRQKRLQKTKINAFNSLVPLARLVDFLSLEKAGLSAIIVGVKK